MTNETNDFPTYKETVYRFRVLRHDELSEDHKQEMREMGMDPDNHWNLIASFADEANAVEYCRMRQAGARSWQTFRVRDAGKNEAIERLAIF